MKNSKILNVLYLIFSNLVLFYCIHKIFFSTKILGIILNFLLSLSCLNFAVLSYCKNTLFDKKQIWYIISEWFLGFLLVTFLTKFFFIRSLESQIPYWLSIFIASYLGGIITVLNHTKSFKSKIDLKKYSIQLLLLTTLFPLVSYLFFKFGYRKVFYDLSFFIILPEIIIVLIWQIFNILILKKGCR